MSLVFLVLAAMCSRHAIAQTTVNPVDVKAKKIATSMLSGSAPAADLVKAVQNAGFSIASPDGTVITPPVSGTNQGLAFDTWEVQGMKKMARDGVFVSWSDLRLLLQGTLPELQDAPFDTLLLDDIRADANSAHPGLRFWARFIVELGRQSPRPYDLMGTVDLTKVRLSSVQAAFILRRLGADLYLQATPETATPPSSASTTLASAERVSSVRARTVAFTATKSSEPCTFDKTQKTIVDTAVSVETKGFKQLLKYVADRGSQVANLAGKLVSGANKVLSAVKLYISYAALKATMQVEPSPVVRTKDTTAGEQGTVTATFTYDLPNASWVNCSKMALASMGLKYSIADNGPATGLSHDWLLKEGGGLPSGSDKFVQWKDWPLNKTTDSAGVSRIVIEGAPQTWNLPSDAFPVMKTAKVAALIQLQPANIFKDMAATIGGAWAAPVEILKRTRWYSFTFSVPVKDWAVRYKFSNLQMNWDDWVRMWANKPPSWEKVGFLRVSMSGRFCGNNPYKDPWFMDMTVTRPNMTLVTIKDIKVNLTPAGTLSGNAPFLFSSQQPDSRVTLTLSLGPPAKLTWTESHSETFPGEEKYLPLSQTQTIAVQMVLDETMCK